LALFFQYYYEDDIGHCAYFSFLGTSTICCCCGECKLCGGVCSMDVLRKETYNKEVKEGISKKEVLNRR
jgi:hypothetical protein